MASLTCGYRRQLKPALLTAVLLPLFAASCHKEEKPAPAAVSEPAVPATPAIPKGEWTEVTKQALKRVTPAVGTLKARQTAQLGSQVNGRVASVSVDVGSAVKKGQELLRLDSTFFDIELQQARAELEASKAAQGDAQLNYERMKNLWVKPDGSQPSIPRKSYDDAKAAFDSASARLEKARGALAYSEQRLKESTIRAPFDGVVTARLVDPGEPVTSTPVTHVLEVQEISTLELEFSLPQEMLSRVKKGLPVEFDVEGDARRDQKGTIDLVYPGVNEATRSFRCRVLIDNRKGELHPGALAQVRVMDAGSDQALVIPRKALSSDGGSWKVLKQVDGKPVTQKIETGLVTDEIAEITNGLAPGDKVLVPENAL